ncbi:GvpL/GvpF family gas vesicle protein [Falsiroseomonas sp. E2-1-a20]|uniref:GvpL/GvpF family gas vesicle protein n=1 Tax=Falsiroseomonas sp. E2-1-a20 TaxID=3239300 RepID=UPI003F387213
MDKPLRFLGAAPAEGAAALAARLGADVRVMPLGAVAALLQPGDAPLRRLFIKRDRAALLRQLKTVQTRLEVACQAGPFLACDPGAATCPESELRALLEAAAEELEAVLARFGRRHQWDVILRWAPEAILREHRMVLVASGAGMALAIKDVLAREVAQRSQALRQALAPHVIAIGDQAPCAGDGEAGATVIIRAGVDAAIETALGALPETATRHASCDLRGPLPPLALGALRIARTEPKEVAAAWALLGLPERLEPAELTQLWRGLAAALHPDRQGPRADAAAMAQASAAYRLLRQEAARQGGGPLDRQAVLARAGSYLALPDHLPDALAEAA